MTDMPAACEHFAARAEELAVGWVDEPERASLLTHAARCLRCQSHLGELTELADRLLLLAPQHEPPAGLETRVVDGIVTAAGAPAAAVGAGPGRRRRWLAAAAVVAVVAGCLGAGVGVLATRDDRPSSEQALAGTTLAVVRTGVITRSDGTAAGRAMLVRTPTPAVVITINAARPRPGEVHCELVLSDGTATDVGTWGYDDVRGGVWAVGIDDALLAATSMRVRDEQGEVLAWASLT